VSDCGAVGDVFRGHKFAATPEEGIADVFKAGMDLICGDYRNNMSTERAAIVNSVRQGLLPESVVDTALRRLFTARFASACLIPRPLSRFQNHVRGQRHRRTQSNRSSHGSRISGSPQEQGRISSSKTSAATIAVIGPTRTVSTRSKAITTALRPNP